MDMERKKQVEKFQQDYDTIFSKEKWEPHEITLMKDLQKLMYYIEVRCAMKEASDDNWNPDERSYRGQMRMPHTSGYGRRYYDGEKEDAINRMYHLMDNETNPEARKALQMAIRELEAR